MSASKSLSFVAICLMPIASLGAIWDCDRVYLGTDGLGNPNTVPINPGDFQATRCTGEGGGCSGPGRIYYGKDFFFTYKDVKVGEYAYCGDNWMGCDPLPGIRKECYNGCSQYHICPNSATITVSGASVTIDSFSMCDCQAVRSRIRDAMLADQDFAPNVNNAIIEQAFSAMNCAPEVPRWTTNWQWIWTRCWFRCNSMTPPFIHDSIVCMSFVVVCNC